VDDGGGDANDENTNKDYRTDPNTKQNNKKGTTNYILNK
jgi:hypothetical protein